MVGVVNEPPWGRVLTDAPAGEDVTQMFLLVPPSNTPHPVRDTTRLRAKRE